MIDDPLSNGLAWLLELASARLPAGTAARPLGIGWATVDLDRAEPELVDRIPGRPRFERAEDDSLLGARCRLARAAPGRPVWVLLEPATEGRLAAFLVRHGEGPAAGWFEAPATGVGGGWSPVAAGPLGPERRLLGGPGPGPEILVVERGSWPHAVPAGTIGA
jgi:hypothetical protein